MEFVTSILEKLKTDKQFLVKCIAAAVAAVAVLSAVIAIPIALSNNSSAGKGDNYNSSTDGGEAGDDNNTEDEKKATAEELIRKRIETFVHDYNAGDMAGVLNSMDEKSRNTFLVQIGIFEQVVDQVTGKVLKDRIKIKIKLSDLFTLGVAMSGDEDYMEIDISEIRIAENSKRAIAVATMDYYMSSTQTVYFEMLYELDDWYVQNMTNEKPDDFDYIGSAPPSPESGITRGENIGITQMYGKYGEHSLISVKYMKEGVEYWADINTDGGVIFSDTKDSGLMDIGGGAGYTTIKDANWNPISYTLHSPNGKQTVFTVGEDFDELVGYGEGMMLVYKDTSTMMKNEASYGVIGSDGSWIRPLTPARESCHLNELLFPTVKCNNGIFEIYDANDEYRIYDTENGNTYCFAHISLTPSGLEDKVFYGLVTNEYHAYYKDLQTGEEKDLPESFKFNAITGSITALTPFKRAYGDVLVNYDYSVEKCTVYNMKNGKSFEYDYGLWDDFNIKFVGEFGVVGICEDYQAGFRYMLIDADGNRLLDEYVPISIDIVACEGDYALLKFSGADGYNYYMPVDKEGKYMWDGEPVQLEDADLAHGRVICQGEDFAYMVDVEGKEIVSKSEGFSELYFVQDAIVAKKDGYFRLLDKNGDIITIEIE